MARSFPPLLAAALLLPLPAQTAVVVPAEFAGRDAPGLGEIAGLSQGFRQQVLLRAEELAAARGREIVGLTVRRDQQLAIPLRGGRATLVVRLSERARHPALASATFADNRGPAPVEVFRGEVAVPEAPAPQPSQAPVWSAPMAVVVTFTRPFVYRGGNVCLEIDGQPVLGQQPPAWPVDFVVWSVGGRMTYVGRSCDARLQAMAVWKSLIPGGDAILFASGPAQSNAVCLFGPQRQPPLALTTALPFDCEVHVTPFSAPGFVYPRVKLEPITRIEWQLTLPALPCLFSQQVAMQWLQLPNATTGIGLATTHAQVVQFADRVHVFAGATVRSGLAPRDQFPEHGEVLPFTIPVLQLTVR